MSIVTFCENQTKIHIGTYTLTFIVEKNKIENIATPGKEIKEIVKEIT